MLPNEKCRGLRWILRKAKVHRETVFVADGNDTQDSVRTDQVAGDSGHDSVSTGDHDHSVAALSGAHAGSVQVGAGSDIDDVAGPSIGFQPLGDVTPDVRRGEPPEKRAHHYQGRSRSDAPSLHRLTAHGSLHLCLLESRRDSRSKAKS